MKKKLSKQQTRLKKAAKLERQKKYKWIFINGKQVRIKRQPLIDDMPVDEFGENNYDSVWLHQNELWELMEPQEITHPNNMLPCVDAKAENSSDMDVLMSSYYEYSNDSN